MSTQQGPLGIAEGLVKLTDVLADEGKRAGFADNPEQTMREAGVPPGVLPAQLMEALGSMSHDQLKLISDTCEEMKRSGMYLQLPNDGGQLCFL